MDWKNLTPQQTLLHSTLSQLLRELAVDVEISTLYKIFLFLVQL